MSGVHEVGTEYRGRAQRLTVLLYHLPLLRPHGNHLATPPLRFLNLKVRQ